MQRSPFPSKFDSLYRLNHLGFKPNSIIDIGVNKCTIELIHLFPSLKHYLVEPLIGYNKYIEENYKSIPHEIFNIGIGSKSGFFELQAYSVDGGEEPTHSMLTKECMNESADSPTNHAYQLCNGMTKCKVLTLDEFISKTIPSDLKVDNNILLKVDVDSVEYDILKNIGNVKEYIGCIVIECRTELLHQFIEMANNHGYYLWEFCDVCYLDNHMSQFDLIFISEIVHNTVKNALEYNVKNKANIWERYYELSSIDPNSWTL